MRVIAGLEAGSSVSGLAAWVMGDVLVAVLFWYWGVVPGCFKQHLQHLQMCGMFKAVLTLTLRHRLVVWMCVSYCPIFIPHFSNGRMSRGPLGLMLTRPWTICETTIFNLPWAPETAARSDPNRTQFLSCVHWRFIDVHQGTWAAWATLAWAVPDLQWWLATVLGVTKTSLCVYVLEETLLLSSLLRRVHGEVSPIQKQSWLVNTQLEIRVETEFRCLPSTTLHNPLQPSTTLHHSPQRYVHSQRGDRKRLWSSNSEQYCQYCASTGSLSLLICLHYIRGKSWKDLIDPTQKLDARTSGMLVGVPTTTATKWKNVARLSLNIPPEQINQFHFSGIRWSNNPKTGTVVFAKQPERLYFSGQEVLGVQHPMLQWD